MNHRLLFITVAAVFTILSNAFAQQDKKEDYKLPPSTTFFAKLSQNTSNITFPKAFRGIPLSLDGISVAKIGEQDVIWIPVLMKEPELPVKIEALTIDPINWEEQQVYTKELGRRSIHFMEIGSSMLYAVAIDPDGFQPDKIGVGLIVVKRISENMRDVLIYSYDGTVLAAARGEIKMLDPNVGKGTLVPIADQEEVRKKYKAKWDLDPNHDNYPLMSK